MKKIINTTYHRNEFDKAVFTDAIIYTKTLAADTPTQITNEDITSFGVDAITTTATQITFDTLVGNLPWSSYTKFPVTEPRTTSPSIPTASLPPAGAITITEGSNSEVMYYGSITWTSATAGTLNNVRRPTAVADRVAFTTAATGSFTNAVPVREYIEVWNRSGAVLYIGDNGSIYSGANAVQLADNGVWGIWLEPLQNLWAYSTAGGAINIAEYR
jgi:hypothetical protein